MEEISSPQNSEDVDKLLSALRSERVRCKAFEKAAKAVAYVDDRLRRLESLCDRLAADQQALRADVRRDLAPVSTLAQEVEDLGAAVQQLIRDN